MGLKTMNPHFLFPASPLDGRMIDEALQDQATALKQAGFGTSTFHIAANRITGAVPGDATVVYRGWMMTESEYSFFCGWCLGHNLNPLTDPEQYVAAHHLPNWYPLLEQWTPSTSIFPGDSELLKRDMKKIGSIL